MVEMSAGMGDGVVRWVSSLELELAVEAFDRAFDALTWVDIGGLLTCQETDALAGLLNAVGLGGQAELMVGCHAESDRRGDSHVDEEIEEVAG